MSQVTMRAIVQCFLLGFTLCLLAGCALVPPGQPAGALPQRLADGEGRMWWAARFKVYWPEAVDEPDWAVDHLLAHAVIAPVLAEHTRNIPLWRFHRRAGRGPAGHQFSFIFYSDAATAGRVLRAIEQHQVTQAMLDAGFVEKLRLKSHNYPQRERVAATSDPNWSAEMQRNWPVYIMGVSAMWLGLVDEYASLGTAPDDAAGMLRYYRGVEQRMTALWRAQGMHALFHHLSGVFGYESLPVGEQEVRF